MSGKCTFLCKTLEAFTYPVHIERVFRATMIQLREPNIVKPLVTCEQSEHWFVVSRILCSKVLEGTLLPSLVLPSHLHIHKLSKVS